MFLSGKAHFVPFMVSRNKPIPGRVKYPCPSKWPKHHPYHVNITGKPFAVAVKTRFFAFRFHFRFHEKFDSIIRNLEPLNVQYA